MYMGRAAEGDAGPTTLYDIAETFDMSPWLQWDNMINICHDQLGATQSGFGGQRWEQQGATEWTFRLRMALRELRRMDFDNALGFPHGRPPRPGEQDPRGQPNLPIGRAPPIRETDALEESSETTAGAPITPSSSSSNS